MSIPRNAAPDPQPNNFIRTSETESTCILCFRTVRCDRYLPIEEAEKIHSDVCLVRADSAVSYISW